MAATDDARPETLEGIYGSLCAKTGVDGVRARTLADVVQLAVELAREGREGRKIGTLFVIGEPGAVLDRSRQLVLDPLYGHASERARTPCTPVFAQRLP